MTANFFAPYWSKVICLILLQIWCQIPSAISVFNCTQTGYFPDSQDPSKFYRCVTNSGSAREYDCPDNKIYNAASGFCVSSTIASTPADTTTQKTPTSPVTQASRRPGRRLGHQCFSKGLRNMVNCFKNESKSWKKYLRTVSSSNNTKDILKKAVNDTDEIFSAFDKERNSSQGFNPFDVLKILDDIGRDVANKSGNTTVTAYTDDIFIEISPLRLPYRFPNYSHNAFVSEHLRGACHHDFIEFPKGLFNNSIAYHAVSALYLGLADKLPTRLFQSKKSYLINSHMISSLIVPNISTPFEKNIIVILKHLRALERGDYSVCAYWDYTLRINESYGAWSRDGCHVMTERSNKTHTTCSCNHLTNFAILMGSENIPITKTHEFALSVITYIGCALSLFGSVAAIAILVVLTVMKDNDSLQTDLFCKPTDTHQYLLWTSCHPVHCKKSIPILLHYACEEFALRMTHTN